MNSEAVVNIAAGADVKEELDKAVQKIDQDIKDNQGYPTREGGDLMAFASMIIIPVLIALLLFQKWFLRSVALTGIIG
ncbi:MAG TPA: hypothetical protein VF026_15785 [Ktedonobacteraceae bacterium]